MSLQSRALGIGVAARAACCACLAITGCGQTEVVSVDGSSTVFLISAAVVEEFNAVNPRVNVVVGKSGTGGGMNKFAAGEIDVCGASRKIEPAEVDACKAANIDFVELQVAFDGLAVVANPKNEWCDQLTTKQLRTIWRKEAEGSIMKWSDVDAKWPEEPLKLYGPGHDSGTFDYFTEVINGEKANCRSDYSPSEDDNALVTGVAGDKGSLCYFGYGYYAENTDKLKLLAIDSGDGPLKPNRENVRDGTYAPLARPLYIYVRKSALKDSNVVQFVKFYLANAGSLCERVGYVAVTDDIAEDAQETLARAIGGDAKPAS
jgi:phosphate transport system substrate-binding protein